MSQDQIMRDFMLSSAANIEITDELTIVSLNDTVQILTTRNANWREEGFCCMIFIWQASMFLDSHADQVCQESCPELKSLMLEYREHQTMMGLPLSPLFGVAALEYIYPQFYYKPEIERFGSSPVENTYFIITEEKKDGDAK